MAKLKQSPFPNQNWYPDTQWTIPLTLAYGDGLVAGKTVAMKETQTRLRPTVRHQDRFQLKQQARQERYPAAQQPAS
ncbi:putative peptidase M1 membrane alanine aminopeptidase [Paraburkholderia xenovorans LB400]|uniref:hypothetical protein n=1 Tax=Paraburkholderia xenovorans TaxID=36873 RepID=UPI000037DC74|nr:hypothetical protein [Paraburkholderia xenovorans]AIP36576.1 putative peptidase M1 membrane alanine aminopeptidase [Paraburkholderia xenovorans LB400]